MQSKTSCSNGSLRTPDNRSLRASEHTGAAISWFNKTVFKKNLTRFAPVWVVYALGLCVWLLMLYSSETMGSEYGKRLGFVFSFSWGMVEVFMYWNLAYGLLVAQLLFGDLFNSRMCNALHAMPLRRETWFVTNCLSGLVFSVVPTLVGMLVLIPMLAASIVENAWTIALLWFLATNLQFICCFGIAAFAAMCVGSRLTMAAGYGLLHFGAQIVYWLVNTVYTPMLYGVQTPSKLANDLTPMAHMNNRFVEIVDHVYEYEVVERGVKLSDLTLRFALTEHWWRLFAIAAVGLVFAALAVLLYRKRDLECAGDAVAFPILKPVFQVLCSLFVMCAGQFVVTFTLGMQEFSIVIMAVGLVAGWFIAKMLIEHSTRVFRPKNWYGLGILAACMALTLTATYFDVLNIEQRLPNREKLVSVRIDSNRTQGYDVDESQWDDIIRIHQLAAQDQVENQGLYIIQEDGSRAIYTTQMEMPAAEVYDTKESPNIEDLLGYGEYVQAGNIRIIYTFQNGSTMVRLYNIWGDGEIGELARKNLSSWESLTSREVKLSNGERVNVLDAIFDDFLAFRVSGYDAREKEIFKDEAEARSFLEAVKKDCAAGLMAQVDRLHRGVFALEQETYPGESYLDTRESIYVSLEGREAGWDVWIYPDCVNTMNWLKERDLIRYDIYPDAVLLPG